MIPEPVVAKVREQSKKAVDAAIVSQEIDDYTRSVTIVNQTNQDNPRQERRLVRKKYHKLNSRDIDFLVSNNMASVKDSVCLFIDLEGFFVQKKLFQVGEMGYYSWNEHSPCLLPTSSTQRLVSQG